MKKKLAFLTVFLGTLLGLAACAEQTPPPEQSFPDRQTDGNAHRLGAEEDAELLQELTASFQAHYAGEAASVSGTLYAYPLTADNGYFLYYNKAYFSEEDVQTTDRLEDIRRSMMNIHRLALSHIVAADHSTMIQLVQQIKEEEASLDEQLASYRDFVTEDDEGTYRGLLEDYDAFKHALVGLVCASADSKAQDAYAMANGDVAARELAGIVGGMDTNQEIAGDPQQQVDILANL